MRALIRKIEKIAREIGGTMLVRDFFLPYGCPCKGDPRQRWEKYRCRIRRPEASVTVFIPKVRTPRFVDHLVVERCVLGADIVDMTTGIIPDSGIPPTDETLRS